MQQDNYLESKVLTATPQRLHLMLVEGAIRFCRRAEESLRRGDKMAASAPLLRAIDIVGEMLAGVRGNRTELNKPLADVYWYLFRRVSQAKIKSDLAALTEALQLLEFERQTWQLVCEKFGGSVNPSPLPTPHTSAFGAGATRPAGAGISFQV